MENPLESSMNEYENTRPGAKINSDTYLYGRSIIDLRSEPYETVLLAKIHLAKLLMHDLVHVANMQDNKRMEAVARAEQFNRELLKEINYTDSIIAEALKVIETTKDLNKVGTKDITTTLLDNFKESIHSLVKGASDTFEMLRGTK